jgi:hypothetical protein
LVLAVRLVLVLTSQQLKFLQQHLEQRLNNLRNDSAAVDPRLRRLVPTHPNNFTVDYSTVDAAVKYIQRPHLPGRSSSRPPLTFYFLLFTRG